MKKKSFDWENSKKKKKKAIILISICDCYTQQSYQTLRSNNDDFQIQKSDRNNDGRSLNGPYFLNITFDMTLLSQMLGENQKSRPLDLETDILDVHFNHNNDCVFISASPECIEDLISQIPNDPDRSIRKLAQISNRQMFSVPNEVLGYLLKLLQNSNESLKHSIFCFIDNILSNNEESVYEYLSRQECLLILWNEFPNSNASTILSKIITKNPEALNHISTQQIASLFSIDNPDTSSILEFFSKVFSSNPIYGEIMDHFALFACMVVQNTNDDNLKSDAKKALSLMAGSIPKIAGLIIPFLPSLWVFDEDDSFANEETLELLESVVKSLNTYEVFNKEIMEFLLQCFCIEYNDILLFEVLKLLTDVEDVTPLNGNLILVEKIKFVLESNSRYDILVLAVTLFCRLIKHGQTQDIAAYLNIIDFSNIFEYVENDDISLQHSILTAVLAINTALIQDQKSFISAFFEVQSNFNILEKLQQSPNDEIMELANAIFQEI